jgi:opacity protein-like surface antigen
MRHEKRYIFTLMIMLTAFICAGPAQAEDELLPDGFMLRVGGYHIRNSDSIVRLDVNGAPVGAYIDFQETLGGDSSGTVGRLDGLYRFNDKHGLGFSWYSMKFNGSKVLGQDITWNGNTYLTGTPVESELKFNVAKVNYQYSLFHNKEVELGVSAGLHIMSMAMDINGNNNSGNGSVTAPMPVFGLFADYNFSPRLSAFYNYQVFFFDIEDKYKGGLQDFLVGLEYRVTRNIALGAAYNRFALGVEAKRDLTTLFVNTNWNGGMLYGAVYF